MPRGYPGSGPKKQGSERDPSKDPSEDPPEGAEKKPRARHRRPHNLDEALVSVVIKPQGATREGAYASDGSQNNGSITTGHPWRQPTVQSQQMPPRVPALNLSHFARGTHVQPPQIPERNPSNFALGAPIPPLASSPVNIHSTSDLPQMSFDADYLAMMNDPLLSQGFVSDQGQGYDQWPVSYQADMQANNAVTNGTQQGFNMPFPYTTPLTNPHVAGPSHSDTGAQSAAHGYNRQAMPYSAQHPGTIPYRNDYIQTYPASMPPPPHPPGAFIQPPAWHTMPKVQMSVAQQHPVQNYQQYQRPAPPAQANQEYHFSNYTPIDQYQGVGDNTTGNLRYNNPHLHAPAPLRPASNQAPNFVLADRASEPSVAVDARSRKRRRDTTRGGSVGGEVPDEAVAVPSTTRGRKRQLARQAQVTAEEFRVMVERAAAAFVAEHEYQAESEVRREMPAEYRAEEDEVPEQGVQEHDQAQGHSNDLENGRQSSGDIRDSGYISQERNSEEIAAPESTGQDNDRALYDDEAVEVDHPWDEFLVIPSETDEQEIEENGQDKRSG